MKTRKIIICVVLILPLFLFAIACENEPAIETIEWELDGSGFRQFETNDPENLMTYWYYWIVASYQDPSTSFTVEAEVKKLSGCPGWGADIMFCFQDPNNFYELGICTTGYYTVWKLVNGNWSMIIDWTFSSYLNIGYNVINNLKVMYDGSNTFTIYLNGTNVDNFTDSSLSGGYVGYIVFIADESCEKFPDEPVDVRFKLIQPVTDP